jgi:thiamine pyrophosphokinase
VVKPGDMDSATDSITILKNNLANQRKAREKFQTDVETLSWVVEELKKTAYQLTAYVPPPVQA